MYYHIAYNALLYSFNLLSFEILVVLKKRVQKLVDVTARVGHVRRVAAAAVACWAGRGRRSTCPGLGG